MNEREEVEWERLSKLVCEYHCVHVYRDRGLCCTHQIEAAWLYERGVRATGTVAGPRRPRNDEVVAALKKIVGAADHQATHGGSVRLANAIRKARAVLAAHDG